MSFNEDLEYSHAQSGDPMWAEMYSLAFPNLIGCMPVPADGWAQRGGIDRVLVLASGKTLYVDEKIRREAYDDICLEYGHQFKYHRDPAPGWVAKDLACDFIAYGWEPKKTAYLLPFQQLRRAWEENKREWKREFFISKSDNKRYVTHSCCVPVAVLLQAISDSLKVSWS